MSRTTPIIVLGAFSSMGMCCVPQWPWTVQSEVTFALNPNGSGKADVEAFLNFPLDLRPREGATKTHARVQRAVAANAVRDVLLNSKTVDAWRDVSWGIEDDGRVRFAGTALFPSFDEAGVGSEEHMILGPGHGMFRRLPDGRCELAFPEFGATTAKPADDAHGTASADRDTDGPTDEQIAERMEAERRRYSASRPHLLSLEKGLKRIVRFRLPGTVERAEGLRSIGDDGLLEAGYDGMARVRELDALYGDDERLRRLILEACDADVYEKAREMIGPGPSRRLHYPMGFGVGLPIPAFGAVVGGEMRPLFDYETEVAAARDQVETLIDELARLASLDAIRGGPGRAIWREARPSGRGAWEPRHWTFRAGRYPWRSVSPADMPSMVFWKHFLPILGPIGYSHFSAHQGPVYLRHPYADEQAGSALLVPEFLDLYGAGPAVGAPLTSRYQILVEELDSARGGDRLFRLAAGYLESGDESGARAEYRIDFPGYFGLEGGSFHVPGRERTYVRFSNAFAMGTRAVASLDLGTAWLDSEHDDARFQWGASADLFPRKPLVVHVSWHSLDGSAPPSETRASVGVALKAVELTAGRTRDRGPAGKEDFLELGARVWWAF